MTDITGKCRAAYKVSLARREYRDFSIFCGGEVNSI